MRAIAKLPVITCCMTKPQIVDLRRKGRAAATFSPITGGWFVGSYRLSSRTTIPILDSILSISGNSMMASSCFKVCPRRLPKTAIPADWRVALAQPSSPVTIPDGRGLPRPFVRCGEVNLPLKKGWLKPGGV